MTSKPLEVVGEIDEQDTVGARIRRLRNAHGFVPVSTEQGGPGVVVFAEDVTDQRDAELARTQSAYRTERFAALAAAVALLCRWSR